MISKDLADDTLVLFFRQNSAIYGLVDGDF
jgi:hypothetical protein